MANKVLTQAEITSTTLTNIYDVDSEGDGVTAEVKSMSICNLKNEQVTFSLNFGLQGPEPPQVEGTVDTSSGITFAGTSNFTITATDVNSGSAVTIDMDADISTTVAELIVDVDAALAAATPDVSSNYEAFAVDGGATYIGLRRKDSSSISFTLTDGTDTPTAQMGWADGAYAATTGTPVSNQQYIFKDYKLRPKQTIFREMPIIIGNENVVRANVSTGGEVAISLFGITT